MQIGTVSGLWFRGRSWKFKIHFRRNIVYFWKSYICSDKLVGCARNKLLSLTVQQNLKSSRWMRDWDWMVCLLWNCGISLFLFLDMFLVFEIDRGNLIMMITNTTSLTTKSMWWKTLMLFLQMFNLRVKKLYCMCLRTMKQWSRWSLKEGVLQWDMFPDSQSCAWLVIRSNQLWFQNPNQIHRHQKPTRWHPNRSKFHRWWVESFVELVQH